MAKGKHAAALFEVIHSGRQLSAKDKSGLLRTPKWWFKGRKKEDSGSAAAPAPRRSETVGSIPDSAADPSDSTIESASTDATGSATYAPSPSAPGIDMSLDPDSQQITFRFSYTSAIVTTFALLVIVSLAYVIGRHMSRGPAQALAGPSTEQVRQGPANSDVLNVNANRQPGAARQPENREADEGVSSAPAVPQNTAKTTMTQTGGAPTNAAPATPGKRTINLNYVIIQSYPDEAGAREAAKILADNGIGTTIEKGLRGYGPSWFIVVGTDGFSRISSQEYASYVERVEKISDKLASRKSFKAFRPTAYKWDRA